MFVVIVGCGRVGSSIAKTMLSEGHEVSVLDEDPEAIAQLEKGEDRGWEDMGGAFTVGTALELDALLEAGVDRAGALVSSTDGGHTNPAVAPIAPRPLEGAQGVGRGLAPAPGRRDRGQGR